MKNKKLIAMLIITLICIFMTILLSQSNDARAVISTYENIINKVDNKESFNLLLQDSHNDDIIEILIIIMMCIILNMSCY